MTVRGSLDTVIRCIFVKYRIGAGIYRFKNNMLILADGMSENFILNYTVFNENDDPSFSSETVQIPVRMLYKDTVFADTLKDRVPWTETCRTSTEKDENLRQKSDRWSLDP